MVEASIPVDLFNPGQVFACMGFLEAADVLLGDAEGGFDWSNETHVRFRLRVNSENNPFGAVLRFLEQAEVEWLSPNEQIRERDGGTTIVDAGISPSATPTPADLPGRFVVPGKSVAFGFWADGSRRFNTTFKKSTNGASSHVRLDNGISAVREIIKTRYEGALFDPFNIAWRTESLFRLDPRGSTDPIHDGFSPDTLRKGKVDMRVGTYPICEILAIIGLEDARPVPESPERFRYCVWGGNQSQPHSCDALLPPVLARAALCQPLPFQRRRVFIVRHQEVKRGGDRKMISVIEETRL